MDGEVSPRDLEDLLVESDALVVDVRDEDSYRRRHIPGSDHVPFPEIPQESDRIAQADRVVTVCYEGIASVKAARLIASHKDFDGTVESLSTGMEGWGGPVDGAVTDGGNGSGTGEDSRGDGSDAPDAPF